MSNPVTRSAPVLNSPPSSTHNSLPQNPKTASGLILDDDSFQKDQGGLSPVPNGRVSADKNDSLSQSRGAQPSPSRSSLFSADENSVNNSPVPQQHKEEVGGSMVASPIASSLSNGHGDRSSVSSTQSNSLLFAAGVKDALTQSYSKKLSKVTNSQTEQVKSYTKFGSTNLALFQNWIQRKFAEFKIKYCSGNVTEEAEKLKTHRNVSIDNALQSILQEFEGPSSSGSQNLNSLVGSVSKKLKTEDAQLAFDELRSLHNGIDNYYKNKPKPEPSYLDTDLGRGARDSLMKLYAIILLNMSSKDAVLKLKEMNPQDVEKILNLIDYKINDQTYKSDKNDTSLITREVWCFNIVKDFLLLSYLLTKAKSDGGVGKLGKDVVAEFLEIGLSITDMLRIGTYVISNKAIEQGVAKYNQGKDQSMQINLSEENIKKKLDIRRKIELVLARIYELRKQENKYVSGYRVKRIDKPSAQISWQDFVNCDVIISSDNELCFLDQASPVSAISIDVFYNLTKEGEENGLVVFDDSSKLFLIYDKNKNKFSPLCKMESDYKLPDGAKISPTLLGFTNKIAKHRLQGLQSHLSVYEVKNYLRSLEKPIPGLVNRAYTQVVLDSGGNLLGYGVRAHGSREIEQSESLRNASVSDRPYFLRATESKKTGERGAFKVLTGVTPERGFAQWGKGVTGTWRNRLDSKLLNNDLLMQQARTQPAQLSAIELTHSPYKCRSATYFSGENESRSLRALSKFKHFILTLRTGKDTVVAQKLPRVLYTDLRQEHEKRTIKTFAADQYYGLASDADEAFREFGFVDRDYKIENVALDENGHVCKFDFDLGLTNRDFEPGTPKIKAAGSIPYIQKSLYDLYKNDGFTKQAARAHDLYAFLTTMLAHHVRVSNGPILNNQYATKLGKFMDDMSQRSIYNHDKKSFIDFLKKTIPSLEVIDFEDYLELILLDDSTRQDFLEDVRRTTTKFRYISRVLKNLLDPDKQKTYQQKTYLDAFLKTSVPQQHQEFVRKFLTCDNVNTMKYELLPQIYNPETGAFLHIGDLIGAPRAKVDESPQGVTAANPTPTGIASTVQAAS